MSFKRRAKTDSVMAAAAAAAKVLTNNCNWKRMSGASDKYVTIIAETRDLDTGSAMCSLKYTQCIGHRSWGALAKWAAYLGGRARYATDGGIPSAKTKQKRKENKSKRDSMFISVRYTTVIFCAPWERWMRRRQSIREGMTRFGWRAALVDKL